MSTDPKLAPIDDDPVTRHIKALVDAAPPLSEEQQDRLRLIFVSVPPPQTSSTDSTSSDAR